MADYLEALDREMAAGLPGDEPVAVDTIFVGGGTPTYLPEDLLDRFLTRLTARLRLEPGGEFTVESNPNTLTPGKVASLARHGVNRVSLGAQSFQKPLLTVLERDHDPESVPRAVAMLRPAIAELSVDLIFAVPGQSEHDLARDLDAVLALGTDHLSSYGLTFEKGTDLFKRMTRGEIGPIDEELERGYFETVMDRLTRAGFLHYEISNYARRRTPLDPEGTMRPEDAGSDDAASAGEPLARRLRREARVCRHNLAYWANDEFFGFGCGAAAYVGGERTLNTRDLEAYLAKVTTGGTPIIQRERLAPEDRARETVFVGLRRLAGIERADFQRRVGLDFDVLFGGTVTRLVRQDLLADDGAGVRLTPAGLMVADGVIREFFR